MVIDSGSPQGRVRNGVAVLRKHPREFWFLIMPVSFETFLVFQNLLWVLLTSNASKNVFRIECAITGQKTQITKGNIVPLRASRHTSPQKRVFRTQVELE